MATASQVKAGLNDAAQTIRTERQALAQAKARIAAAEANLAAIPTVFADVIQTVNGYGTANAFEAVAKAELAKLFQEFSVLKDAATEAKSALAEITEF